MEIFGDLERLVDDLYPYRWLVLLVALLALSALLVIGYRRGWGRTFERHKLLTACIVVPTLVLAIPLGYYLLSPLWTRTTLVEESPLAVVSAAGMAASVSTAVPATPTPTILSVRTVTPTLAPSPTPPTRSSVTAEPVAPATLTPEPEPTATPEPAPAFVPHVVAQGQLSGADDIHFAEGTALLIETGPGVYVVRLENFSVRNGPDLFVYLSPSADGIVDGALNLGGLKATDGSINYAVPPGTDIAQFPGIVIWCRQFAVLFGTAPLG